MTNELNLRLPPEVAGNPLRLQAEVSRQLNIDANRIKAVRITRRSIDARQRRVMVNLSVRVDIDQCEPYQAPSIDFQPVSADAPTAIVVGAGPAGLFAALRLITLGIRPIVLERGHDVDTRRKHIARLSREGCIDPDSNYCFGEGGAGAFSDGKLYTRSKKRGSVERILTIFHQHGAAEDVLIDAHPHIGSDRLPGIIAAMRHTIIRCGGQVIFRARVTALQMTDGTVAGVTTADGTAYKGPVILATGHSARDVYHMLAHSGVPLEAKGLAVGVRLEHPQALIDRLQYHSPKGRGQYLPPAEYSLLTRVDDRAVYSFCMCPGGIIIPAVSDQGQLVVNGMSPSNRGSRWANSGMVVEILPEDIPGDDPLRLMRYQEGIERAFWQDASRTLNAPAQRMTDFVAEKGSTDLPATSYAPGIHPARIDRLLPRGVSDRLRRGFEDFNRRQRGFLTPEAVLIGAETRTSSPVRITRHPETLSAIPGLYPAGEGAGYAGGIVSAAIDGERAAEAVAATLKNGI